MAKGAWKNPRERKTKADDDPKLTAEQKADLEASRELLWNWPYSAWQRRWLKKNWNVTLPRGKQKAMEFAKDPANDIPAPGSIFWRMLDSSLGEFDILKKDGGRITVPGAESKAPAKVTFPNGYSAKMKDGETYEQAKIRLAPSIRAHDRKLRKRWPSLARP